MPGPAVGRAEAPRQATPRLPRAALSLARYRLRAPSRPLPSPEDLDSVHGLCGWRSRPSLSAPRTLRSQGPGRGRRRGRRAAALSLSPPPGLPPPSPGSAILIPAPSPSAPRRAPQATHLGHGLPVAGHRLLDEAENFHAAVSARHDHPGPPEAHGHFHAAVPRWPRPERHWARRLLHAGRGGAAAPARRRLGARAGGGGGTEPPGYHVQSGRLRLASPRPSLGACSLRPPVRRLGVLARSAAARGRVALALSRDSKEGTARPGGGAERRRARRTAPRAGGWRRRRAGRREASAAARPLGSPRGDAHRSPRRWVWAGTGQGASSSSNPLALELQR